MEWLTLALWILVLAIGLPLAAGAIYGRVSLGLEGLAAVAGLAVMVIYLLEGQPVSLAWAAAGIALLGSLAVSVGAVNLVSDRETATAADPAEATEAGLAGVVLPLFWVTMILTVLVALEIGTS